MNARGIDENRLRRAFGFHAHQLMASSLWLARGDTQLLTQKVIEQSRFTDIWPADNCYQSAKGVSLTVQRAAPAYDLLPAAPHVGGYCQPPHFSIFAHLTDIPP